MSARSFLEFLTTVREDAELLERYDRRNLAQLLFHSRNDGFDFTTDDVAQVVSALEASVVLGKDQDSFDGGSRLWRHMWGHRHLSYLVAAVVCRHTDEELWRLVDNHQAELLEA